MTPARPAPLLPRRARYRGALVAAALTGGVCMLAALPPFLGEPWRVALMQAFHAVCHQLPDRSFAVGGVPLAVCHRCTGIYLGLFAGALAFPLLARFDARLWPRSRGLLALSLAPMALDWGGDALGLFVNTPLSRTLTGAVFGVVAAYLLAHGLAGLFLPRSADVTTAPA